MHSSTLIFSLLAAVACVATSVEAQVTTSSADDSEPDVVTDVVILTVTNFVSATALAAAAATTSSADADLDSDSDAASDSDSDSDSVTIADSTSTVPTTTVTDTSIFTAPALKPNFRTSHWNMSSGTGIWSGNHTATGLPSNWTTTSGTFTNSSTTQTASLDPGTVIITATGTPTPPEIITSVAIVTGTVTQPTTTVSPTASLAGNSAGCGKKVSFVALFVAVMGLSGVLFS